jgi:polysaccharide biosynthesis transport protein
VEESTELDIGRYLRMIYKKRVLFALIAMTVTSGVVFAGYLMPQVYEARSIIFIERNFLNDLIKNVTITPSFDEKIKALATVMKSRSLLLKVMGDLDLDLNSRNPAEIEGQLQNFQDRTEVKLEINRVNPRDTDLFIVSYTGNDPKLACNYVNTLVRRYIEENLSKEREEAYGASRFLLEQISSFKEKINQAEADIAKLKRGGGVSRARQNDQLLSVQKKLDDLLVTYTESHPDVVKLKSEIEQLKMQLKNRKGDMALPGSAEADTPGKSFTADAEQVNSTRTAGDTRSAASAPAEKKTLPDLERELTTNKKIYEDLLTTLGKSQVSTQAQVQDKAGAFRILDPAVIPTKPIHKNIIRMILLGMLGGIGAGIAVIIGMDMLDTSVKSVDTAKKLGFPVLAVIPIMRTSVEISATRKRDRLLYMAAGLYVIGLLTIVTMEFLELPYVGDLVQGTKTEIKNSLKRIW